jgi:hypothetical protein
MALTQKMAECNVFIVEGSNWSNNQDNAVPKLLYQRELLHQLKMNAGETWRPL